MLLLKILFIAIIFLSQMYVMKFQSSDEGNDERGKEIQLKTNSTLYNLLYLGIILLVVLHLCDVVPTTSLPDLLLYFILSISVFGTVFTFVNKHRSNY
ncbi:hypothetical protein [Metabacillus malikii]|uniref:Transcriptional regulator n=1 Tax=Metabacillus malikii TaxID=1504265 RepID=A0ABT9ZDF9_9BACI|nr:hypothetical protein [Metabacillus malikii]MDQ0229882.1 putative transcriptional regulator [Metabacillus malikii]